MKYILLLSLLITVTVNGQMSMPKEPSIVDLNIKPQTIYNKEVNMKVITFLTGATMTTIGVVNILNGNSFDHKSVRNTIPLDPHRVLIGVGLTTFHKYFYIIWVGSLKSISYNIEK